MKSKLTKEIHEFVVEQVIERSSTTYHVQAYGRWLNTTSFIMMALVIMSSTWGMDPVRDVIHKKENI